MTIRWGVRALLLLFDCVDELCTKGGWPHVMRLFLRLMLVGPEGFISAGVPIEVNGAWNLIWARVQIVIGDVDGLRLLLSWRGANAIRPCPRHSNVTSKRSGLQHLGAGAHLVDICCHDHRRFVTEEPGYLEELMDISVAAEDQYLAGSMSSGRFDQICKASGFHPDRFGLLSDPVLRLHLKLGQVTGAKLSE